MSRIKAGRLLAFALVVLLFLHPVVLASEQQDILDAAQMTPQQFNYQTTVVERGSLIKETHTTAAIYYPLTYPIRFEQDHAKFVEYTVARGDTVKAGDILAHFSIAGSDAEFTRMELNLKRTEEQTAEGIREREQEIAKKREEIAGKRAEIAEESAAIAEVSDEIPEESDEIPGESDEIPEESDEIPGESDEIPGESDETPEEGDETPGEGDETPGESDETPEESNEIAKEIHEYELVILELSLKKLETELEQYKSRQQYSMDQQRKAYNEENTRRATDVLISPVSGVVKDLTYKKADDAVSPDEILVTISSEQVVLFEVQNDSGDLRYNMPVEVQFGNNSNPISLTGRVVAADDAIPEKERTGYAYIQLDAYDAKKHSSYAPKVTAQSVRLDNVLLVSKKAARQEAGKYYVTKLTDGMVQKRCIEVGMNNIENVWVLAGVEEGETLILD